MIMVMAADAGSNKWRTASPSLFGDPEYEIRTRLGADAEGVWRPTGGYSTAWFRYERVDWLGGRHERFIKSLEGRVHEDHERYRPFAETPPWLKRIRIALTPAPK